MYCYKKISSIIMSVKILHIHTSIITAHYMFQGKGLMQTFWLLEEMKKGSPPKNKQKLMYPQAPSN